MLEPDGLQTLQCHGVQLSLTASPCKLGGQHDVFKRCQCRQQACELAHKTDWTTP
ncbi:MAG: Uncharacterised protein [Cyanobium sp. ARS6]|nr:MAG: Uncharacterised protein [Cyanobium sp. ARS6]